MLAYIGGTDSYIFFVPEHVGSMDYSGSGDRWGRDYITANWVIIYSRSHPLQEHEKSIGW